MKDRQLRFIDEYLTDCNGTQAAIRAGYSPKSAGQQANRLLKNANIKAEIQKRLEEMKSDKVAGASEVLEYLTSVLRGESQSEVIVVEGIGDGCSEAKRMLKAPDEKERLKAADLLAKRYGLTSENVHISSEPVTIINDLKE